MWKLHLSHLCCPSCRGDVAIRNVSAGDGHLIQDGVLRCVDCDAKYPVIAGIPRFVPAENYASSFGVEWSHHARTQYDSHSGIPLSERRFFEETRWPRDMRGDLILEVGSGSGRFTEHAASTGATVVSVDYSMAVEANYESNGARTNVLIAQGDIFRLPVRANYFDRLFCFGVLQHTPDPRAALLALPEHVRPGGNLVADVYVKSLSKYVLGTKYWVRPLTKRLSPETLYRLVRRYIDAIWPLATVIRKIPRVGAALNWRLLVGDYTSEGLSGEILKEWAYLDTFDMLAPRYDYPQRLRAVREWLKQARLVNVEVGYGYNGIEIRADKPLDSS
jgi:SAM-dependent methyltransferase